jgi:hypothetical protein
MNKKKFLLAYTVNFTIVISLILFGLFRNNSELIKSGISLFAFTVPALIGSIFGLKIKTDKKIYLVFSILFSLSLFFLVVGYLFNLLHYGIILSVILGIISISYLVRKNKNFWNSKEMINNEASSAYALSKLKTFRQKLTWIFFYFKNDHKPLGEYNNEYIYA